MAWRFRPMDASLPWRLPSARQQHGWRQGQVVHLMQGTGCYGMTFSPDGSLLALSGCDRTVKLWEVANGHLWLARLGRFRRLSYNGFRRVTIPPKWRHGVRSRSLGGMCRHNP